MPAADSPSARTHDANLPIPTGVTLLHAKCQGGGGWAAAQAGFACKDQSLSDISWSLTFPAQPGMGFAHLLHTVKATRCLGRKEAMAAALV